MNQFLGNQLRNKKWEKEGEIIIHISFGQHPTFLQIELDPRPPSDRGLSIYSIQTKLLLLFTIQIHIIDVIDTKLSPKV